MDGGRHKQRRRRQGVDAGKLIWLVAQATGDLADAIDRDLFNASRDFDELGWRGLWAYITTAPPGTAIFHKRSEGWSLSDKIAAENLSTQNELVWRYTAVHFEGGSDIPFPKRISYPGAVMFDETAVAQDWQTAIDDISPEVQALLRGA